MTYTVSTHGQHLVLTLTPDMTINSGNIYKTESLLEHAVSSPIACLVFNLEFLLALNAVGRWTLYQVAYQAKKKGKLIFLYKVPAMLEPMLSEAGIFELAGLIRHQQELNAVIRGELSRRKTALPQHSGKTAFPLCRHSSSQQTDFPDVAV